MRPREEQAATGPTGSSPQAGRGRATKKAIAALLHDAVEDGKATRSDIRERFGDRVAAIVEGCSISDDPEIALSTVISDALVEEIIERAAFADVAADAQ